MPTTIDRIECRVLRAPIAEPVANAFGAMSNRPALFLRLVASDGAWGWGEVFCNFPQVGAEHRARLVDSLFVPLLQGAGADDPDAVRTMLEQRTRRMAIQCGEPGPFAQVVGAVDQAMWDLVARREGQPLWRVLARRFGTAQPTGGDGSVRGPDGRVRVYASGIGPDRVVEVALARRAEGYRAFKLKVGFSPERDASNLAALRDALGPDATLMCDANQAWTPQEAAGRIDALAPFAPYWIEEPIPADEPPEAWRALAARSPVPLAAGENLRGEAAFDAAIDGGWLRFVQPDVGKWGGVGGGLRVAARAARQGIAYCPHWLAGGIGLAASMHALAASGCANGWAEVDANPNPLREEVFPFTVEDGWVTLPERPGLGVEPDLERLARFEVGQ
jgi:D-galactarolactone cycloisomerase